MRVRISKETLNVWFSKNHTVLEQSGMGNVKLKTPDFIEVEGESVKEKCNHPGDQQRKLMTGGLWCTRCDSQVIYEPIEELGFFEFSRESDPEMYLARCVEKIWNKTEELVRAINELRK